MTVASKRATRQFGDFQTPTDLAKDCCRVIDQQLGVHDTVVEPTCGRGNFLIQGIQQLHAKQFIGFELNQSYVRACRRAIASLDITANARVHKKNFFDQDWDSFRSKCGERVLYFGNPPWVTNAEIGMVGGNNLPNKVNIDSLSGLDAVTGKANFDLSESIIQTLLTAMRPGLDSLAMLIKGATVRRVADYAWKRGYRFGKFHFYQINAKQHFDASVDAGMMIFTLAKSVDTSKRKTVGRGQGPIESCRFFQHLSANRSTVSFGRFDGKLVRDPKIAKQTSHLAIPKKSPTTMKSPKAPVLWRSGVKHDASRILELNLEGGQLSNRDGARLDIELDHVFPLAKGSEVAGGVNRGLSRAVLLPQSELGQSTTSLQKSAPKTYAYLNRHRDRFAARRSSIYRDRDPFAIFGVGDYTFSPWKIAVCGLYKRLTFTVYGPVDQKPVVFDDTTYLLPCRDRDHAKLIKQLLDSDSATRFFNARIFWEAKRPINSSVLRSLDLRRVAQSEGLEDPDDYADRQSDSGTAYRTE